MLMVVYDAAFDDEVLAALSRSGAPGFTQWRRVLGRGQASEPRMDDSVWPGYNHALVTVVEEGAGLEDTVAALSELNDRLGKKGLKAFSWPVAMVI
jgi:hypothetical protein